MNIETLKAKVYEGAKAKKIVITDEVLDRWETEFEMIEKMGYTEFFLINGLIAELCNKNNWFRLPGFGGELSSFVYYCLDVTRINPIEEKLVFETYLNPFFPHAGCNFQPAIGRRQSLIEMLKPELPDYNFSFWAFPPIDGDPTEYDMISFKGTEYCVSNSKVIIAHKRIRFATPRNELSGQYYYIETDEKISYDELNKYSYTITELGYLNKFETINKQLSYLFQPYNLVLDDSRTFELFSSRENLEGLAYPGLSRSWINRSILTT